MHGRLKVKSTAEQQAAKQKEREKKLKIYKAATSRAFELRKVGDYGAEALEVTGELLAANSDFSSLWNFRREIILNWLENKSSEEIQKLCEEELHFLENCLKVNPKSYGTWHHREWVLNHMPKADWKRELVLCNTFLEYDERNFHCWDYRRIVVKKANVSVKEEFDFSTKKISTNFSNFSSWHYRSKLLPKLHPDSSHNLGVKEEALNEEYELVQNAFFTDPSDQSAWFYHKWLLGRGDRLLHIDVIHVSRESQRVFITLTKPAKVGKDFQPSLLIDEQKLSVEWHSPGPQYSQIWIAQLPEKLSPEDHTVMVSLGSDSQYVGCALTTDSPTATWRHHYKPGTKFSYELSAATSKILTQEFEAIQQLHEMEPDNKWVLLTMLSLIRALDPRRYQSETKESLDKLIKVDPMRKNYYLDLRSKFIIEDIIDTSPSDHLNVSHQNLTCLYHGNHLATIQTADVSHNALTSIKEAFFLQCARTINLDDNKLHSLTEFKDLPCLEELSIKNNYISCIEELKPLASCGKLNSLHLDDNPVCEMENFKEQIKQVLPQVTLFV